jgi:hypothetical protein
MQPEQIQQSAYTAAVTPVPQNHGQFTCWYAPGATNLNAIKITITLYVGWLVATDANTGTEVFRYTLTPDIRIKRYAFTNEVFIKYLNGQKHSVFSKSNRQYLFYFSNPRNRLISLWAVYFGGDKAKAFVQACRQAAGSIQA